MNEEIKKYEVVDESLDDANGGVDLRGIADIVANNTNINFVGIITELKEKYPNVDAAIDALLADMHMFGEVVFNFISKLSESQIRKLIKSKWNTVQ